MSDGGGVAVPVVVLPHGDGLPLPCYQTEGAAGMDAHAAVEGEVSVPPGGTALVPTGLRVAVPEGFELQVRPRSGLALRHAVSVLNTPGTVDSDYRGEVGVILVNHGREAFTVRRGDRVAQLVLAPVARAGWVRVDELPPSGRGAGGFGHTGA